MEFFWCTVVMSLRKGSVAFAVSSHLVVMWRRSGVIYLHINLHKGAGISLRCVGVSLQGMVMLRVQWSLIFVAMLLLCIQKTFCQCTCIVFKSPHTTPKLLKLIFLFLKPVSAVLKVLRIVIVIEFWILEEGQLDLDQEVDQDQDLKGSIENDQGTGSLDKIKWQPYSPQNLILKQLILYYFNIWQKYLAFKALPM